MEVPARQIDHEFLEAVEAELEKALQRTCEMERRLEAAREMSAPTWQGAFASMSANLADWRDRLAELTRQTAAAEAELNEHERALRDWFASLGLTTSRLEAEVRSQR